MDTSRLTLVLAVLLLFFFLSTSNDFAQISAIQEKLREAQIKLLKASISTIQEQIDVVRLRRNKEIAETRVRVEAEAARAAVVPSREVVTADLEQKIKSLQQVVDSLKPRATEEEVARIENRVAEINKELVTASGARLLELRVEMQTLLTDYEVLQGEIRKSLAEAARRNQALLLQNQVRALQEKVLLLPRTPTAAAAPVPDPNAAMKVQIGVVQEKIQALQLKILQEKASLIQGQIDQVRK